MNLRDLEYLVAVAEHRHFGKAAEICHVSQPTLSMQLKKLEEYLGVQLFERTNKQVMVTPVGEVIAGRARVILQNRDEIRAIAKTAQDPFAGDFQLGVFPTLAPYLLPKIIPEITAYYQKMKLFLVEEKTAILLEQLEQGKLDAALLALPLPDDSRLEILPLFEDKFFLAVPRAHPFASRKTVTQADLAGERLLLLEDGHCMRNQALQVCNLLGASEYQEFRATSLETLRQMVAAGVGMTLIPEIAINPNDGIVYIPFKEPAPYRAISLVWRKSSARTDCITSLGRLIKQAI